MRSQTDEMLAARHDDKPWACYQALTRDDGKTFERVEVRRHEEIHEGDVHWDPRIEMIPSYQEHLAWCAESDREPYDVAEFFEMRPPVNPILVEFRANRDRLPRYLEMLADYAEDEDYTDFTPDQIEHARKVLTRLAALA